jgi:hypothetical protein
LANKKGLKNGVNSTLVFPSDITEMFDLLKPSWWTSSPAQLPLDDKSTPKFHFKDFPICFCAQDTKNPLPSTPAEAQKQVKIRFELHF